MAFAGRVCAPSAIAIETEPRGQAAAEVDVLYAWPCQRNGG